MKKITTLFLCLLFLFQTSAFAEVERTLSDNNICLSKTSEHSISGTNQILWISISRSGFFKKLLGLHRVDTFHYMGIEVSSVHQPDETDAISPVSFSQKNPPYFLIIKEKNEKRYYFKPSSISKNRIDYDIDNKTIRPLATAEKVNLVFPLKDGTTKTVEIPEEVLNDWKYIITCNLWNEYEKGI